MNVKFSGFVIYVEVIIYFLLYVICMAVPLNYVNLREKFERYNKKSHLLQSK